MEVFKTAKLVLTIVGGDLVDIVFSKLRKASIDVNTVNLVNEGKLGNFRTLTYETDISDDDLIYKRRTFMDGVTSEDGLMALYEHGDWMNVYILGRWAFKTR